MVQQTALALIMLGLGLLGGCSQLGTVAGLNPEGGGISKPGDLGLVNKFQDIEVEIKNPSTSDADMKVRRNDILSKWVMKSDYLCSEYQVRISRSVRDSRLATDVTATILSGLATIFTRVGMIHPLSGAATVVMGIGGDIQSDLFLQQAGDVIVTAMQTTRSAARKELQKYWSASYADYTLAQALLDVERYDRETRGGRLCLDRFSRLISGSSAGCRRGVPFSGWHAGRA